MLDFFKSDLAVAEAFEQEVEVILSNKDIKIYDAGYPGLPPGWHTIVKEFLSHRSVAKIHIISIKESFGRLDIQFDFNEPILKASIWRLADQLCRRSTMTCMKCGNEITTRMIFRGMVAVVCSQCEEEIDKLDQTGTWLDQY